MALSTPYLVKDLDYIIRDATEDIVFEFNVNGGDKVVGNRLKLQTLDKDNNYVTVYDEITMTEEYKAVIPKNSVRNGFGYRIFLYTIGEDGSESTPFDSYNRCDFRKPFIKVDIEEKLNKLRQDMKITIANEDYYRYINSDGEEVAYKNFLQNVSMEVRDLTANSVYYISQESKYTSTEIGHILEYSIGNLFRNHKYRIIITEHPNYTHGGYYKYSLDFEVENDADLSYFKNLFNVSLLDTKGCVNVFCHPFGTSLWANFYYGISTINSYRLEWNPILQKGYVKDGYYVQDNTDSPFTWIKTYDYVTQGELKYLNKNFFFKSIYSPMKEIDNEIKLTERYGSIDDNYSSIFQLNTYKTGFKYLNEEETKWLTFGQIRTQLFRVEQSNKYCCAMILYGIVHERISNYETKETPIVLGLKTSNYVYDLKRDSECCVCITKDGTNFKVTLQELKRGTLDFENLDYLESIEDIPFDKELDIYDWNYDNIHLYSNKYKYLVLSEDTEKKHNSLKNDVWDEFTFFICNFNGTLDAGSIPINYDSTYAPYYNSLRQYKSIKITKTTNGITKVIADEQAVTYSGATFLPKISFKDYENKNGQVVTYKMLITFTDGTTYEEEKTITFRFCNTIVANVKKGYKLNAMIQYGGMQKNENVSTYLPLKGKFPIIQKNSDLDYNSGSISALMLGESFEETKKIDRKESIKQAEEFTQFLLDGTSKIIKDWNGSTYLVKFTNAEMSYDPNYGNGVAIVRGEWVEQGDPLNYDDLVRNGIV